MWFPFNATAAAVLFFGRLAKKYCLNLWLSVKEERETVAVRARKTKKETSPIQDQKLILINYHIFTALLFNRNRHKWKLFVRLSSNPRNETRKTILLTQLIFTVCSSENPSTINGKSERFNVFINQVYSRGVSDMNCSTWLKNSFYFIAFMKKNWASKTISKLWNIFKDSHLIGI